jgi:hypothetical protein
MTTITVDRSALEAKVKDMYTAVADRPDGDSPRRGRCRRTMVKGNRASGMLAGPQHEIAVQPRRAQ